METFKSPEKTKITDFFPSSPSRDDPPVSPTIKKDLSDILPTPDASPEKDPNKGSEKTVSETPSKHEDVQVEIQTGPEKVTVSLSSATTVPPTTLPTKTKTGRSRRRRGKKTDKTNSNTGSDQTSVTKPIVEKKPGSGLKKKKDVSQTNHVLTDYFPVRRSGRKCVSNIKKDEETRIEEAVLNGKEVGLKVVEFEGKGRGVVATQNFRRGGFVVEYAGDLIDLSQAKERETKYAEEPDKFGCYMYYFTHKNKNYCVDATLESGRLGRLLNHSKKGNCHTKLTEVKGLPRLILVASQDIESGDELLYDYGDRSKSSMEAHPWLKL